MSIIARFDIRTMLACQLLLSVVFAIVFLSMRFGYCKLKGIGSIATGFLLGIPGVFLLTLRGTISDFASIVLANTFILCAFVYFYSGVRHFFADRHRPSPLLMWLACLSVTTTVMAVTWYSMMEHRIVPRIVAISLSNGFLCVLIAVELFRHSARRRTLRLFAYFMLFHVATNLFRIFFTLYFGTSADFMHANSVQALAMISDLIFVALLGIFFQIMVASELTHAVEHRATHDLLTGVLNRHGIEERLNTELDRAGRNGRPLSAILIDVDRFKEINDAGGHALGDEALRIVSKGIAKGLRSYDLLGRYGGDEFLLLLPETQARHAVEVADRIRALLAVSTQSLEPILQATVSIGVAETLPSDTAATLLARADAALYDAKHAGRNCVRRRFASGVHPSRISSGSTVAEAEAAAQP